MTKTGFTLSTMAVVTTGLLMPAVFAQERDWRTVMEALGTPAGGAMTQIAAAQDFDGRLAVFGLNAAGNVAIIEQVAPNGGWSSWHSLAASEFALRFIAAAGNQDGRLEVFGLGEDFQIYHNYQTVAHSYTTPWSGWIKMTGLGTAREAPIVVGTNADGRLEAFALTRDCGLSHAYQQAPNSEFTAFFCLAQPPAPIEPRTLRVVRSNSGRLEAYGIGYDNLIYRTYQQRGAPNFDWVDWETLPALYHDPTGFLPYEDLISLSPIFDTDGRAKVLVRGTAHYYSIEEASADSTIWAPWQYISAGPPALQLAYSDSAVDPVARNADGRLELVAAVKDGSLYHIYESTASGPFGPFTGVFLRLATFPGTNKPGDSRAMLINADGRLEVFTLSQSGVLFHSYQL